MDVLLVGVLLVGVLLVDVLLADVLLLVVYVISLKTLTGGYDTYKHTKESRGPPLQPPCAFLRARSPEVLSC